MRLSAVTKILTGQPLPTTPAGDSLDERIAECFVGEPPASSIIRKLIEDVKAANATATDELAAAKAKALDLTASPQEIAEARRIIDDAGWRQARTEIAGKRLAEVLERVQRAEQDAERDARRLDVIQRRDAMATELRDRYPGLVNDLMDLLLRMQAVDAEARSFGLPTSEDLARPGAVPGGTPATPLSMCRLIDFERQWHAHVWVDGRHIRNIGGDPAPAPAAAPTAPATQTVPTSLVTLTNPTNGQRMTYFDYANASHFIQPRETLHGVRVLDTQLPTLREYLSVEVIGAGEPVQRPA